jgi:DNA-binding transcriptional LysR family regulator
MRNTNVIIGADKLDSDLLRTFIAIADSGSFTKGADRIYRSQSAVSLQIKRLEEILGERVFERQARGVSLTPIGEKLRPVAQRIVSILDVTIGELRKDALEGSIRIGIPDEYGETLLPEVIGGFARNHPRVEVAVRCGFSTSFPDALARDEIDLAVYAVESPKRGTTLLRREKTFWVGSRYHSVHEQDPVPVALFDRACWWRDQALEALDSSEKRYRVVYSSESVTGVLAAISAGVAVGLLGESSLRDDLMVLPADNGFPTMPQSALVLESRNGAGSSVLEAMVLAIRQAFK